MKTIFLILSFLTFSLVLKAQTSGYKSVSAADFKLLMENNKGVLIDLRTPDEIKKGKIKGALEMDFLSMDIEQKIDALDKTKTYFLYCQGGGRSADCAELMVNKGFKKVINLEKGFSDWKKSGFEIETK